MPFESRSNQMNRKIHSAKDTLEQSSNNAQHAVKFARLGAAYAIELAKATAPQAYVCGTHLLMQSEQAERDRALARGLGLFAIFAALAAAATWLTRRAS